MEPAASPPEQDGFAEHVALVTDLDSKRSHGQTFWQPLPHRPAHLGGEAVVSVSRPRPPFLSGALRLLIMPSSVERRSLSERYGSSRVGRVRRPPLS